MKTRIAWTACLAFLMTAGAVVANDKGSSKTKLKKLTKPVKQLFVGRWSIRLVVDKKKAEAMLKKQGIAEENIPKMIGLFKKLIEGSKLVVNIHADGTTDSRSVTSSPDGTEKVEKSKEKWEFVSSEGRVAKVKLINIGKKKTRTISIRFVSDNTFELLKDPDLAKLPVKTPVFRRVLSKSKK